MLSSPSNPPSNNLAQAVQAAKVATKLTIAPRITALLFKVGFPCLFGTILTSPLPFHSIARG